MRDTPDALSNRTIDSLTQPELRACKYVAERIMLDIAQHVSPNAHDLVYQQIYGSSLALAAYLRISREN
jgi:hypothetical protein